MSEMNIRPIDANALLELYEFPPDYAKALSVPIPVVVQNILDMPALDYAPVRHGEWLGCENYNDIAQCSLCGLIRNIYRQEGWNYCPNCGAKMGKDG